MNTIETLPANIAVQLANLETRHKRHQEKMQAQHDAKHERKAKHRARHFKRSVIPILFV